MQKLVNGVVVDLTDEEIAARQAEEAAWQEEWQTANLVSSAKQALSESDMTAIRCLKAGVEFPQVWQDYVAALRQIIASGSGDIPDRPDYPEGT